MRHSYQKVELPANFAQQLLEREIEVRLLRQPIEANLCKLLQLYSSGFEYYESIGSYKFRYFQQRMREVFLQQEEENERRKQLLQKTIASIDKQQHNQLINSDEALLIDKKSREQQRVEHFKELTDLTSVKSTNEQIRNLLLTGDYKAIEVYTRVTYELQLQKKILKQKLQLRHRRSSKQNTSKDKLKMNSTKTSLLSQQSRKGQYLSEIKQHIFQKLIGETQDEGIISLEENCTNQAFFYMREDSIQ